MGLRNLFKQMFPSVIA